ncbi:Pex19-domain-containing protein [Hygrophoropsis aurantiaca]|uniref:Pex19-domain-containing protein n=1 Tax=Hygrophoropsis aurantiaca TaxID=72124 RepID=A0ACB8A6J7_9AGAM|nr:Pex19-domain-containing protein [Hygrophoropsis aurantiaca]
MSKSHIDEEDDLDDLDDVLDQFSPSQSIPPATSSVPPQSTTSASAKSPVPPSSATKGDPDITPDFASELARGMESLMREMGADFDPEDLSAGTNHGVVEETPQEKEARERAFAAAWEAMLIEGMDGMVDPALKSATTAAPGSSSEGLENVDGYQSRIRAAANKLKESESTLKSSSEAAAAANADPLEALLAQLGDLGGEGGQSEEGLQGMLEMMMTQLMSKDVLHEPLKELSDKFPGYLEKNATTLSAEDKTRYDAQIVCIRRLLDVFEAEGFDDNNEESREKVVELMGELQTYGSPPEEIMGPLPPGFNMGADGLPNVPENCIIC